MLSFGASFTDPQPRYFPFVSPPLIAPFWSDELYPSLGGSISYRQTSDLLELQSLRVLLLELDTGELRDFYPTHMFVATWYNIPSFQGVGTGVVS